LLKAKNNLARQCVAKEACVNKRRDTGSISNYLFPALSMLAVAAVGCAGQTPAAHDARAAGQWTFRLPETRSPYAGLAIANPGQSNALGLVDDALETTPASQTPVAPKARPVAQPRTVLAKNTQQPAPAPVSQPAAATPPSVPAAAPTQPEQLALNTPPAPDAREEMRYSQREQQSQKQRDFRGGDAIVISASALVIVLLIVILILLLT
jgi:hypothetical protein